MKKNKITWYVTILFSICLSQETLPLSQRFFHNDDMGYTYGRGTYMIILADATLESVLKDSITGDFINFKKTQGYKVKVKKFSEDFSSDQNLLAGYLKNYSTSIDSMLEYILLILL